MIKILSSPQIRHIDECTIQEERIASVDLMERAACIIYNEIAGALIPTQPIYIFAGTGNNGGDALAIARMLVIAKFHPEIFITGEEQHFSTDCRINKERLEKIFRIHFIHQKKDIPAIKENSIVIDGLFGSGINRPLEGIFAEVVNTINESSCMVYAIDMPSGLFVEDNTGNKPKSIIKADKVYTFQFPKLSLLLPENSEYCEEFKVLDIGLSETCINQEKTSYYFLEKTDISQLIKPRNNFSHKGNFGHALLITGSLGKMGASVLSARACLHTGVGLLTAHVPKCGTDILQTTIPEAMVSIDKNTSHCTKVEADFEKVTVGIGCGIGNERETSQLLHTLWDNYRKPAVIDADALNLIAKDKDLKKKIPPMSILTPHPVEFERLIQHKCRNGYERLERAREFAGKMNVHLILKGNYTAIITPERKTYFNSTGNPGMATGGSGDVLTGILTSLLAQKYSPLEACLIGVYLHGLAGDLAAYAKGEESMLPSDLINYIGEAYKNLKSEKS